MPETLPGVMPASRYIRRETAISTVINVVMTLVLFVAVFGTGGPVAVWGLGQFAFDFLPQTFMIALMATLVPGMITARKRNSGKIETLGTRSRLPRNLILRALLLAGTTLIVGASIILAVLALGGWREIGWSTGLMVKLVYAGLVAVVITPIGLRAALAAEPAAI